jgi:hypothetical protein
VQRFASRRGCQRLRCASTSASYAALGAGHLNQTTRDQHQTRRCWSSLVILIELVTRSLHGRLPFRPWPSAGRVPPKIPKCSRNRPVCSFGERSSMLSQSRLNRSAAGLLASVGRGQSRWSPSSGLTFSRYFFGGDGRCFGGDGGSTTFSFERLGSTTGGFCLRPKSSSMVLVSSSMMLGARKAARLPARQRKKYWWVKCTRAISEIEQLTTFRGIGTEYPTLPAPNNAWPLRLLPKRFAVACTGHKSCCVLVRSAP